MKSRQATSLRRTLNLVTIIVCMMAFGWLGYWLGHWIGWSENAEWPAQIGGGAGAMALSVIVALVGIAVAAAGLCLKPYLRTRRLLLAGESAPAEVLRVRRAGLTLRNWDTAWEKIDCEVEVRPAAGAGFRARAVQFASRSLEARLQPGAAVEVRYDSRAPTRVVIVERGRGE